MYLANGSKTQSNSRLHFHVVLPHYGTPDSSPQNTPQCGSVSNRIAATAAMVLLRRVLQTFTRSTGCIRMLGQCFRVAVKVVQGRHELALPNHCVALAMTSMVFSLLREVLA